MKILKISTYAALGICGALSLSLAVAQHNHRHAASSTDTRVAVEFPAAMREHTLTSMRDHLLAISQIQEAMGNNQ